MPCRSYHDEPSYRSNMSRKQLETEKKKAKNLKKEADKVTRLLCAVLREYEIDMSPELAEWHAKHEAADLKRMERERKAAEKKAKKAREKAARDAAKRTGIAKLTKAERDALGL